MDYPFYDKISLSGYDSTRLFNPTFHNLGVSLRGGLSSSHSMVFESEKASELVKSPATARLGKNKNETSEDKALAALKSHSEAERRRRERINGHLATLRGLVASNEKVLHVSIPCFYWKFVLFLFC